MYMHNKKTTYYIQEINTILQIKFIIINNNNNNLIKTC